MSLSIEKAANPYMDILDFSETIERATPSKKEDPLDFSEKPSFLSNLAEKIKKFVTGLMDTISRAFSRMTTPVEKPAVVTTIILNDLPTPVKPADFCDSTSLPVEKPAEEEIITINFNDDLYTPMKPADFCASTSPPVEKPAGGEITIIFNHPDEFPENHALDGRLSSLYNNACLGNFYNLALKVSPGSFYARVAATIEEYEKLVPGE
jgi:hypothetical protein